MMRNQIVYLDASKIYKIDVGSENFPYAIHYHEKGEGKINTKFFYPKKKITFKGCKVGRKGKWKRR